MDNNAYPTLYPGWQTVKKIGTGSFGTVYEIERDLFGRKERAALKLITIPQHESDIEELYGSGFDDASITAHFRNYLEDIIREYSLMAEMKGHTNVVYCDDIRYEQHDDGFGWDIYIKMELLTPMMKRLGKEVSDAEVVKLGKDICNALVLCKNRNIIHRDIKPQNIFVSLDGDYKLGDFGIAKTVEKTSGGTKIGTYNYMAPEVYNNQPYGSSADIYSLGLVLYWLLNERRMPFNPLPPAVPTATEMDESRLRRFRGEAIPAPAHGSDELKRIVLKACAYEPGDRYQSAAEMLHDLNALENPAEEKIPLTAEKTPEPESEPEFELLDETERTVGVWRNIPKPERENEPDALLGDASEKAPEPEAPKKKKKWWIALVAAALCIAAVIMVPKLANQPMAELIDISAGFEHTVGLKSDGTVAAAGDSYQWQSEVSTWRDIVAVSAGRYHTVGLKSGGTVVAVGYNNFNNFGQCEVSTWRDIVAVSAGDYHTVGLKSDGTVVAVGSNNNGQCEVSTWRDIVAVSAGGYHTIGLKSDGTVVAVGNNYLGQCEVSTWRDIVAVSAGGYHTIGLKSDGTVVAVGYNNYGQCEVSTWRNIVAVSAGDYHTIGLKSDGTVVAEGRDWEGQCEVSTWRDIVAVSAGRLHTVGLKSDGTVVAVGYNDAGQCDVSGW